MTKTNKNWVCVVVAGLSVASVTGGLLAQERNGAPSRSTNISVSSSDFDQKALNDRLNPQDEKPGLAISGNSKIGVTEDGEPSLVTRF